MYRNDVTLYGAKAGDSLKITDGGGQSSVRIVLRFLGAKNAGSQSIMLDLELAEQLSSQLEDLLRPGRLDAEADARLGRDSTGASASDLDQSYQRALAGGA